MRPSFFFALVCALVALSTLAVEPNMLPTALGGPRINVPTPTYVRLRSAGDIVGDFHTKLALILGQSPERSRTLVIRPLGASRATHLERLREQLEQNRMQPIVFLGRSEDFERKIYAYPIEQTAAMSGIFGRLRPRRLQWAILAITTTGPQDIRLLTYAQTKGPDLHHVRWVLGQRMGSWGTTIVEALRRPPTIRPPV